jgi:hypothetical protein
MTCRLLCQRWIGDSQLPSFKERLEAWIKANIYTAIREMEENPTHNLVVACEREPLPFAFTVEFGAYLNVLRSALDILACTIAARHGVTR